MLSLLRMVQTVTGTGCRGSFSQVKRPKRDVDNPLPFTAAVKNGKIKYYNSSPSIRRHSMDRYRKIVSFGYGNEGGKSKLG